MMIINKKYPASALSPRTITKSQFKKMWKLWRSLDPVGRINELSNTEWMLCWFMEDSKFSIDKLLSKNLKRALTFECANRLEVA